MSLTAGTESLVSVGQTTASVAVTAATGGTGPYTYQWYRSTTTGFSPGGGNIIAGATALSLSDSGLIPNTNYYYKNVVTDTGNSNVTATSTQLLVTTSVPSPVPNQFTETPFIGMIDLRFDYDTVSVEIDLTQSGSLYPGQAVKIVDSAGGIPKVVGCDASTDEVFGFINFDIKTRVFVAGNRAEISQAGNVIYLYATAAIARGAQVCLDVTTPGGVGPLVSTHRIVGYAYDKATVAGDLIRVKVSSPSFTVAS